MPGYLVVARCDRFTVGTVCQVTADDAAEALLQTLRLPGSEQVVQLPVCSEELDLPTIPVKAWLVVEIG